MPPMTASTAATGNGAPDLGDAAGNPLRLLMVHAHPDDETTTTGATAARYAAEGVDVHLVTCTRGERGEILDDELAPRFAGLAPDAAAVRLGEHRTGELAAACARLGITDWRFLAGPSRWWDSGMAGTPTASHPKAFSGGDLADQAGILAVIIRELRPQVVVTYDERGGYGHPDHIRAHEVTMAAVQLAAAADRADGGWRVSKVYACVVPRSQMERAVAILATSDIDGPNPVDEVASADDAPFAVPDELVAARIDAHEWLGAKAGAMRAHRSQMSVNGWFFALIERGGFGFEHYRLMEGSASPPPGERWEDDLFAGLRPARMPSGARPR
jgi:N-acetyl-1-D-myo-inositol-2-amino-2-deoxy-alpha-D-glucopyranoside deacetylase